MSTLLPAGMISHMQRWVDGTPGHNLPEWAKPQRKLETLYPADMVSEGYIYIRQAQSAGIKVGDTLNIDGYIRVVASIGSPEWVTDASVCTADHERVRACRIQFQRV